MDAIITTLLDLDQQLGGNAGLCVGGGLGLYLKQEHLRGQSAVQTRFPFAALPAARTTEDIDLFLRAEVIADPEQMRSLRAALDALGCVPIRGAEFMHFLRPAPTGQVKIDLMAGPPGAWTDHIRIDKRRMRPKGVRVDLHAHAVPEAVAVETAPIELPVSGRTTSGEQRLITLRIPQTYTYLLTKLTAFRDRCQDSQDDYGRRHALDAYRLIGLITRAEDEVVRRLSAEHRDATPVQEVRRVVQESFSDPDGLGLLRIREHPLYAPTFQMADFAAELRLIFPPCESVL